MPLIRSLRCLACGAPLPAQKRMGRKRKYCPDTSRCQVAAWRANKKEKENKR